MSGYSWNCQVPRAPLHAQGVTSCAVASRTTSEGVTPPSSLLRAHASVPIPSADFGLLIQRIFAGFFFRQPLLEVGLSRRYLCESFPTCLDPYSGCSCGALARFFPQDHGLPYVRTRSALGNTRTATSVRTLFRSCSHLLMFRPAGLLATQVAPTAVYLSSIGQHVRIRVRWSFQGFRLGPQSDSHRDTSGLHPIHRAAMAFTSEQYTGRYLPVLRIC